MDWSALGRSMQATVEHLAAIGCQVDASRIRVRSADEGELRRAMELENTAAFGESWFELLRVLDLVAGRTAAPEAARYCAELHARMPVQTGLNYFAGRDELLVHPVFVLTSEQYAHSMVREMYRAYDDQKLDARAQEKQVGTTSEAVTVARAWGRAHAELAVERIFSLSIDGQPTPLEERSGSTALHTRCALDWIRVAGAGQMPVTSEQLLHRAAKSAEIGRAIAPIPLAIEGLALLRDDQLGEIGLRMLLSSWEVDPVQGLAASIGWDGDRFLLRIGKDGQRVLQARILFDRELDAEQWENAVRPLWSGSLLRRGCALDMAWANRSELLKAAEEGLASLEPDCKPDIAKARSTEQVEALLLSRQPVLADGVWKVPEQALSLRAGPGWKQVFEGGQPALSRDNQRVRVSTMPTPGPMSGAELLAAVEATLKGSATVSSGKASLHKVGDRDAVRLEYTLNENGSKWSYREIQVPGERAKLVVTLRQPEGPCDGCDELLGSLRLEAGR